MTKDMDKHGLRGGSVRVNHHCLRRRGKTMGTKPVQALAGLLLVGMSLTGCQSEGGYGGAGGAGGGAPMIGGNTISPISPVGSHTAPGMQQQQLSTASAMGQVNMGNGGVNMNGSANMGGMGMNTSAAATPTGGNVGLSYGQQQTTTAMSPTTNYPTTPVMQNNMPGQTTPVSYTPSQPTRPTVMGSPTNTSGEGYYEVPRQAPASYNQ